MENNVNRQTTERPPLGPPRKYFEIRIQGYIIDETRNTSDETFVKLLKGKVKDLIAGQGSERKLVMVGVTRTPKFKVQRTTIGVAKDGFYDKETL